MTAAPHDDIPGLAAELARETTRLKAAADAAHRLADARADAQARAFTLAECAWLRAVADYAAQSGHACTEADLDRARGLARAEEAAFLAFLGTPAPHLSDLAGKLLAIERQANEVAQGRAEARTLIAALALVRADLLRWS